MDLLTTLVKTFALFFEFAVCLLLVTSLDSRGVQVSHAQTPAPVTEIPDDVCQNMWDNSAAENLNVGPGKDLEVDTSDISRLITVTPSGRAKLAQPPFPQFRSLVESYDPDSNVPDAEQSRRQNALLKIFLVGKSSIDVAYQYLKENGKTTAQDLTAFSAELSTAWFDKYKKKNQKGLFSGFEHTFVGELRGKTLKGFHNWYQFDIEKSATRLTDVSVKRNGYVASNPPLLNVGFTWHGAKKPCSSFLVGPSPAFEMALFTACFLGGPGSHQCTCKINNHRVTIQAIANKDRNIITTYVCSVSDAAGRVRRSSDEGDLCDPCKTSGAHRDVTSLWTFLTAITAILCVVSFKKM